MPMLLSYWTIPYVAIQDTRLVYLYNVGLVAIVGWLFFNVFVDQIYLESDALQGVARLRLRSSNLDPARAQWGSQEHSDARTRTNAISRVSGQSFSYAHWDADTAGQSIGDTLFVVTRIKDVLEKCVISHPPTGVDRDEVEASGAKAHESSALAENSQDEVEDEDALAADFAATLVAEDSGCGQEGYTRVSRLDRYVAGLEFFRVAITAHAEAVEFCAQFRKAVRESSQHTASATTALCPYVYSTRNPAAAGELLGRDGAMIRAVSTTSKSSLTTHKGEEASTSAEKAVEKGSDAGSLSGDAEALRERRMNETRTTRPTSTALEEGTSASPLEQDAVSTEATPRNSAEEDVRDRKPEPGGARVGESGELEGPQVAFQEGQEAAVADDPAKVSFLEDATEAITPVELDDAALEKSTVQTASEQPARILKKEPKAAVEIPLSEILTAAGIGSLDEAEPDGTVIREKGSLIVVTVHFSADHGQISFWRALKAAWYDFTNSSLPTLPELIVGPLLLGSSSSAEKDTQRDHEEKKLSQITNKRATSQGEDDGGGTQKNRKTTSSPKPQDAILLPHKYTITAERVPYSEYKTREVTPHQFVNTARPISITKEEMDPQSTSTSSRRTLYRRVRTLHGLQMKIVIAGSARRFSASAMLSEVVLKFGLLGLLSQTLDVLWQYVFPVVVGVDYNEKVYGVVGQ
ncbi:unnamed protein product [Amoebophrya sp. A25]|nr:unnamed protein product [Amoebophrya sp. A25]|eukprot:GSA25T00000654001.1